MQFKVWSIFPKGVKGYIYDNDREDNQFVEYDALRVEVLLDVEDYLEYVTDWVKSGGDREIISVKPALVN